MRRAAFITALFISVSSVFGFTALADDVPSLTEVIDGDTGVQTTEPALAGDVSPRTDPTVGVSPAETPPASSAAPLPDTGGISTEDIREFSDYDENPSVTTPFRSTLSKVMGTVVPILVGVISACLVFRILIDLLYIVAPFLRSKLAPGAQGAGGMVAQQGGMGMAQPGGYGGGGYGGGGYGRHGGYGGGGYGAMQQQQAGAQGGIQWVSQAALNAVAAGQQTGPSGKAPNEFITYIKSMVVILVIVPIMLILVISGALTNVGFYFGDMITSAIQRGVG
jgi:hypothetical protein